ncbi:MAG: purine-binding chemotaxis protein CheW [Coriobacteriia bacterium]|nr:purine-binding chemotaxis protein CheW [Coriobacteriia bacterium]MBN2840486.1 purine-binding chemotaxis protein CheW [Coriobacteriia bacterium]
MAQQGGTVVAQTHKYLTFKLGPETYGLDILRVQEIIGMIPVTRVPKTPAFVRGVVNLRGRVIPVVDLRIKFETGEADDTELTCIVVVQLAGQSTVMGVVVDEVSEVLDISVDQIEDTPDFGAGVQTEFVRGIANVDGKVIMLLDIVRVLSGEELSVVERLASEA